MYVLNIQPNDTLDSSYLGLLSLSSSFSPQDSFFLERNFQVQTNQPIIHTPGNSKSALVIPELATTQPGVASMPQSLMKLIKQADLKPVSPASFVPPYRNHNKGSCL
jgi:hypothetical protein